MSVQHLKSLLMRSAQIQSEIEREHRRLWPNWMRLLKLKKIRLALKDRIQRTADSAKQAHLRKRKTSKRVTSNQRWQDTATTKI